LDGRRGLSSLGGICVHARHALVPKFEGQEGADVRETLNLMLLAQLNISRRISSV
jgi:hypothetical protein